MTDIEIVNRYLDAVYPSREIGVIADELGVTVPVIMRTLADYGFEFGANKKISPTALTALRTESRTCEKKIMLSL